MTRRRRRNHPVENDPNWVEWGDERIWAVGFTEGGAPYGLTPEEFEGTVSGPIQQPEIHFPVYANWADAKEALYLLLEREGRPPNADAVGFIREVGEGLSNRVFGTSIKRASGQEEWVVVKFPSPTAGEDRDDHARREVAVLRYLEDQFLPFKVPRQIGEIESPSGLAIVQEWIDGMSVDLRSPVVFGEAPWELVARVAAAIHNLDPRRYAGTYRSTLPGAIMPWRVLRFSKASTSPKPGSQSLGRSSIFPPASQRRCYMAISSDRTSSSLCMVTRSEWSTGRRRRLATRLMTLPSSRAAPGSRSATHRDDHA